MAKATYKDAGVDLDVYRESMSRLPKLMHRTFTPRVIRQDGGFAGMFQLDFANKLFARNYEDPVLISCTDGVGTKLKVATLTGVHDTVGIDLVAMSINDALCTGAEPLFFLDYVAMGKDDPELLEQIVRGISQGCLDAGCALLGGETAIMPDLYQVGDYDLAGFCVAVVDRKKLIDGKSIAAGDVVLGVASSGLHSNGFSLARKVVFDIGGLGIDDHVAELNQTAGQALLTPTRIYTTATRAVLGNDDMSGAVHGIAHITGGGLRENLERILPEGVQVRLDQNAWDVPAVFPWIQQLGEIESGEMERVFNMGVGMVFIVSESCANQASKLLADAGYENWTIGNVSAGDGSVEWR